MWDAHNEHGRETESCTIESTIEVDKLACSMTSEAVPHVTSFLQDLYSSVDEEQRQAVHFVESWKTSLVRMDAALDRTAQRHRGFSGARERPSGNARLRPRPQVTAALERQAQLRVGNVQVLIHDVRFQLQGDDADLGELLVRTKVLDLHLNRQCPAASPHGATHGHDGFAGLGANAREKRLKQYVKVVELSIAKQEASRAQPAAPKAGAGSRLRRAVGKVMSRASKVRSTNILVLPHMEVDMLTHQLLHFKADGGVREDEQIRYVFISGFEEVDRYSKKKVVRKVTVSPDLDDYKFMNSIISDFTRDDLAPSPDHRDGFSAGGSVKPAQRGRRAFVRDLRDGRRAEDAFVFKPKLSVTGEITPDLNSVLRWLGMDMHLIPQSCHQAVTDNLDGLLYMLWDCSRAMDRRFAPTDFGAVGPPPPEPLRSEML
eukprot:g708.t1